MRSKSLLALVAAGIFLWGATVYAQTFELYTASGFVELLIQKGIISPERQEKAREFVNLITRKENAAAVMIAAKNADKVSVTVSQYIQYGAGEYRQGEDIKGLLLVVTNDTDENLELEAVRRCQVKYRIYSVDEKLLYDSGNKESCQTPEKVIYFLEPHQSRMFDVVHAVSELWLSPGTYRFELEYPGYGKGSRTISVI